MTRQHIRFSALRSIFWGTLLLFLDFDLNFRFDLSFTVPLLPDCLGFWLVGRGTRSLAADRPSLGLLDPFWLALGLWSLQQFFPGLSPCIPGVFSLLAALLRMYADFQLFTDLAGLAEELLPGSPLPGQLRAARTAAVLLSTLFYFQGLSLRAPWLTMAAGVAGFCARVYILLRLWQLTRAMAPTPEENG